MVGANAMELELLGCVTRGEVAWPGAGLRRAVSRQRELLGVLNDMSEQGLISGELRFVLTARGLERLAELEAGGEPWWEQDVEPADFQTRVEAFPGMTVTGVLPATAWRAGGEVLLSAEVRRLWRDQAHAIGHALVRVVARLDACADERFDAIGTGR
ncbi:MAG: hypothetical protein ACLGI5_18315 [Thermoleophilia bacterium]